MPDRSYLAWPFFADRHRLLADAIDRWSASHLPVDHGDVDAACRDLVARLGRDGWLLHSAVDPDAPGPLDVRTLCLARETLARHDGLADFAFAMQGLGSGPISLFGSEDQRARYLPAVARGEERRVRALRARCGLRRRGDDDDRLRRAADRHQDLDLQRRDRGLLHGV